MNAHRDHHVVGQPPAWSRLANLFRRMDGTLVDRYMRDEERADDRRMSGDRRQAHPGRPGALRRRWIMARAVRRERRAFGKPHRRLRDCIARLIELGNKLMDSWWVLAPLGVMCAWALLHHAGVFKP